MMAGSSNTGAFGECEVPLHCNLWPGIVAPERILSMGQLELLGI